MTKNLDKIIGCAVIVMMVVIVIGGGSLVQRWAYEDIAKKAADRAIELKLPKAMKDLLLDKQYMQSIFAESNEEKEAIAEIVSKSIKPLPMDEKHDEHDKYIVCKICGKPFVFDRQKINSFYGDGSRVEICGDCIERRMGE